MSSFQFGWKFHLRINSKCFASSCLQLLPQVSPQHYNVFITIRDFLCLLGLEILFFFLLNMGGGGECISNTTFWGNFPIVNLQNNTPKGGIKYAFFPPNSFSCLGIPWWVRCLRLCFPVQRATRSIHGWGSLKISRPVEPKIFSFKKEKVVFFFFLMIGFQVWGYRWDSHQNW